MLSFLGLGPLKTGLIILAAAVGLSGVFYIKGYSGGKASVYAELAANAVKFEKMRKKDDAETQILSDYDICARDLGSRGMPIEACDGLRRVQSQ